MEAQNWNEWEQEQADSLKKVQEFEDKGHTRHCACRMVWGDGECECGKEPS